MSNRKIRILYLIVSYPTFSETYMHEEIRSLRDDFEIKILTYKDSAFPRLNPFPYEMIEYKDSCLVFGPIEQVDATFNSPDQQEFLRQVSAIIEDFQPDVMHCHYFGLGLVLRKLAEIHQIPFTIRTHSMDMLNEPEAKLEAEIAAANSPWCLKVLTFPGFASRLEERGLASDKIESCWPVINFARFYMPERRPRTNRVLCCGPAIPKKAHTEFIDLAASMKGSGLSFDLYADGYEMKNIRAHNERNGNVVNLNYVDPDEMPKVYPGYDWLVYPSDLKRQKVGLPASIAEAQACGLGVCWQELPDRRHQQLEFLGGGGFLFSSISELPAILSQPFPEEMRVMALQSARKSDIEQHKGLLTQAWNKRVATASSAR